MCDQTYRVQGIVDDCDDLQGMVDCNVLPDLQNTRDGGLQCVTRLAESTWDWAQTYMVVQS